MNRTKTNFGNSRCDLIARIGLCFLIFFANLLSVSPDFFYNQKEINKAKALSNAMLVDNEKTIFSYPSMIKLGMFNYYSNRALQAEKYFLKALKLTSDSLPKADVYYWLGRSFLRHKEWGKASYYFSQTLNYNKSPAQDFLFFYGIALYGSGKYQDALNCFQNYEAQTQNGLKPKELMFFIAASAMGNEDYVLAGEMLNREELQNNRNFYPQPAYLLALNYYLTNENNKSLNILRRITSDTSRSEIIDRARLVSGAIYFSEGEISKAVKEFDEIIKDTLESYKAQAYLHAGISYLKMKQSAKATERFDSLIQRYPKSEILELAFYYKAKIYEQGRKFKKAKTEYRKFLASYPKSPLAEKTTVDLIRLLLLDDNYLETILVLEDFINNYPASRFREEMLFDLIESYYQLRKYNKAQSFGEQFVREFPVSEKLLDVHYKLSQIGIIKNDLDYARSHYQLITSGKFEPYALKGLGDIYFTFDSLGIAHTYYDLAEQVSSDTLLDEIRFNREKVGLKQGQYSTSIEMFRAYLEKYPQSRKSAKIQFEIGKYYLEQDDLAQAMVELEKVDLYSPSAEIVPEIEMDKAVCYTKLGQTSQATETYLKIANNYPTGQFLPKTLKSLATIYYSIQNYDSAIIYYNRIIVDFPKSQEGEDVFIELAKSYRVFGRLNESVKLLERFIIRYPESNRLKEAYFELADCYKEMGRFSLAEKNINEMFAKFGKSGDGYYKLGKIYNLQNKYALAKSHFINAYNLYKTEQKQELSALSLFEAGKCAAMVEKWIEAKELFNRCINETQDERLRIECQNQLESIP